MLAIFAQMTKSKKEDEVFVVTVGGEIVCFLPGEPEPKGWCPKCQSSANLMWGATKDDKLKALICCRCDSCEIFLSKNALN